MTGKILVVIATIFTFTVLVVASVTIEQPIAHQTYVDPWGYVPEPATLSLLAIGGLAMLRRRKRKAA